MATSNGQSAYQISFSDAVTEKLDALKSLAVQVGVRAELAAVLRTMLSQLKYTPTKWGDMQFEYHHLNLKRFQYTGPLLVVLYAVHSARRIVFVQDVFARSGSPLDVPPET